MLRLAQWLLVDGHGQLVSHAFALRPQVANVVRPLGDGERHASDDLQAVAVQAQASLSELEARTSLTFPDVLRDADTLAVPKALDRRTTLQGTEDIRW
jgi:hypothetical protein